MDKVDRRSSTEQLGAALVGKLDEAIRARLAPVAFVEVDSRRPWWRFWRTQSSLEGAAATFTEAIARQGVPVRSLAAAHTGERSASIVILRPSDIDDEEIAVLDHAVRTSRKSNRLTVIIYPSELSKATRGAVDRWRHARLGHVQFEMRESRWLAR